MKTKHYFLFGWMSLCLLLGNAATAATFEVTNNNDAGAGSLRQAVQNANSSTGPHTITFAVTGTIALASQLPDINEDITIVGPASRITLNAAFAGYRLMKINDGKSVTITNVNFTNGTLGESGGNEGGAINSRGNLTLRFCDFGNNTGRGGGAIDNSGVLIMNNCGLTGNKSYTVGGAISNNSGTGARMELTDCVLSNNGPVDGKNTNGGAVSFGGPWCAECQNVAVSKFVRCSFIDNKSGSAGGAVANFNNPLEFTDCIFAGNRANLSNTSNGWGGGAIFMNWGKVSLLRSTLTSNTSVGAGGAIDSDSKYGSFSQGAIAITNSTLSNNTATNGSGGAVNTRGAELTVVGAELAGNRALNPSGVESTGGALKIGDGKPATLVNCTISGNTAISYGGGVYFSGGQTPTIRNCTFYGNTTQQRGGGGIFHANWDNQPVVPLTNTIVVGNSAPNEPSKDFGYGRCCRPSSAPKGNNIIGISANFDNGATSAGDFALIMGAGSTQNTTAGSAGLAATLANNGGSTRTHALLGGSPAIDPAATIGAAYGFDQRGYPYNGTADIGAFESDALVSAPPITGATPLALSGTTATIGGATGATPLTQVGFLKWGPTPGLGNATVSTAGLGASQNFSGQLTGLSPNQNYSCQAVTIYGPANEYMLKGSVVTFQTSSGTEPVVATTDGMAAYSMDGATPATQAIVDAGVRVTSGATLTKAIVRFVGNYIPAQDQLDFAAMGGITGNWDVTAGALTLTGDGSASEYQAALQSIKYRNLGSPLGTLGIRQISYVVFANAAQSAPAARNLEVKSDNSPVLANTETEALAYTESAPDGNAANPMVIVTAAITVTDPNSNTIKSGKIWISANYSPDQDVLALPSLPAGITGGWDADSGQIVLSSPGGVPASSYQQVFRAVTYRNTSDSPVTLTRTVSFIVNNGITPTLYNSPIGNRTIVVVSKNDAPTLAALETPAVVHSQGDSPVNVTGSVTVADVDNNLSGATVRISGNYNPSQDRLSFSPANGIGGSFDAPSGVLTLAGAASPASYQQALRSVRYEQTPLYAESDLTFNTRTLVFQVNDNGAPDNSALGSNTLQRPLEVRQSSANITCQNYADAFQKTLWFLDVSRAGAQAGGVTLPNGTAIPNRVTWRTDTYVNDGNSLNTALAPDPDTRPGRSRADGTPDLAGGWHDAGDPPKWSPGTADAATFVAWGAVEYPAAYNTTGEMKYLKGNLKWVNDYFLKTFRYDPANPADMTKYRLYAVVGGSGGVSGDDKFKGVPLGVRPENTINEQDFLSTPHEVAELTLAAARPGYKRPIYYADKDAPATATVARVAASMASASAVFRDGSNDAYADELLEKAKMLFNFTNTYIGGGALKNRNGDLVDNDMSGGYWDGNQYRFWSNIIQRCWAALWLHEAELRKNPNYAATLPPGADYLSQAIKLTDNSVPANRFPALFEDGSRATFFKQARDLWGIPGKFNSRETQCYLLMGKYLPLSAAVPHTETNGSSDGSTFGQLLKGLADQTTISPVTSASGLPDGWADFLLLGDMQKSVFSLLVYADKVAAPNDPSKGAYVAFSKRIVDYTLGNNPANRTYLTGVVVADKTPSPNWALHGPAQGFWDIDNCDLTYPETAPRHTLYGALTTPRYNGAFVPKDYNPPTHEAGPGYQAGITGSLARMIEKQGCTAPLTAFLPTEASDGKEYYAKVNSTDCGATNALQVSAAVVNHSAWPARNRSDMSFRYYFTIDPCASVTATLGTQTSNYGAADYTAPGAVLSAPVSVGNNLYYVEASFPGVNIFPGARAADGTANFEKKVSFTLTSTKPWVADAKTNIMVLDAGNELARHSVQGPTCGTVPCANPVPALNAWVDMQQGSIPCASACSAPTLALSTNPSATVATVCQNTGSVTFLATGCAGGVVNWTGSDGTGGSGDIVAPSAIVGTVTYSATCTIGQCVSEASSASVTVRAPPTVAVSGGTTVVLGYGTNCTTLRATPGGGSPVASCLWAEAEHAAEPLLLAVKAYPNPTTGPLIVRIQSIAAGPAQLDVLDVAGRPVQQRAEQLLEGLNEVQLNLSSQSSGNYLIRCRDAMGRQAVVRVSKQ